MHYKRLLMAAAWGLAACAAPVQAPPPTPTASMNSIAAVDRALADSVAKGFGGALIIQQGDDVLLQKGYGFADRERRIAFTLDTVSQIGSITKSQTAAALATLVAEGKVALDDSVGRFIPEAPEPGASRTVAQLLTHRSGLLDSCTGDFEEQSEEMLVGTCLARPLAHPVGEDHYSNLGYSALSLIVQRVAGEPWERAVRARVWQPLGMDRIGFRFEGQDDNLFARGYLNDAPKPVISRSIAKLNGNDWALRGNGGVQASPRTMIRFLNGILDSDGGFPPAARALILSPVPGQSGDVQEGFGFFFRYKDGKPLRVGHAGSDGVFFSYLAWIPANDVRFYFVGNNGEADVKSVLQVALKAAMELPPGK